MKLPFDRLLSPEATAWLMANGARLVAEEDAWHAANPESWERREPDETGTIQRLLWFEFEQACGYELAWRLLQGLEPFTDADRAWRPE